jgi:hypothetical protein
MKKGSTSKAIHKFLVLKGEEIMDLCYQMKLEIPKIYQLLFDVSEPGEVSSCS